MSFHASSNPGHQIAPNTSIYAHRDSTLKNKGITPIYDKSFEKFDSVKNEEIALKKKIDESRKESKYI